MGFAEQNTASNTEKTVKQLEAVNKTLAALLVELQRVNANLQTLAAARAPA